VPKIIHDVFFVKKVLALLLFLSKRYKSAFSYMSREIILSPKNKIKK